MLTYPLTTHLKLPSQNQNLKLRKNKIKISRYLLHLKVPLWSKGLQKKNHKDLISYVIKREMLENN